MATNNLLKLDTTHVVKLSDSNFEQWKLQISLILKAAKLWDIVNGDTPKPGPEPKEALEKWTENDIRAQAFIVPTLNAVNTNHIYNCESSRAMFLKLESIHSDRSALNKQHTLSSFLNYSYKPEKTLAEMFVEVEQLVRHLNEMGVTIDETTAVTKMVSSLPDDKHQAFKKAWDSVPEDRQTMENLLARLRKEDLELKHTAVEEKSANQAKAFQAKTDKASNAESRKKKIEELKKRTKCNKCHKVGHVNATKGRNL